MSNIELKVEDSYSALFSYFSHEDSVHQLSDGSLVMIVLRVQSGPTYDFEIYWSQDNGNTWTLELTFLTGETWLHSADWVGDKLYMVRCNRALSDALLFHRVDYDSVSQTFTHAINGTEIRPAQAATKYYNAACDVEPGGRVWCAYFRFLDPSFYSVSTSYSDDGGATWSQSTGPSASGKATGPMGKTGCHCLEGRTVVTWNAYYSSGQYLVYASRLHTDSVDTWSATNETGAIGDEAAAQPFIISCKDSLSPAKRVYVGKSEEGDGSGNRLQWMEIVEGASPFNLTVNAYPSSGSLIAPAGENTRIRVSGRQNGFVFHYLHSGSLGTHRRQKITNGSTTWPGENTFSTAATTALYYTWGCANHIDYVVADDAFLIGYLEDVGGPSYRPWFLLQNVTSPVERISDLPFEVLADLNFTADLLVEVLSDLNFTADLLAETLSDLVWIADIPVEWFGLWFSIVDSWSVLQKLSESFLDEWHVIATALDDKSFQDSWDVKVLFGADFPDSWRVIPQEIVNLFNNDIQLPKATVDKT